MNANTSYNQRSINEQIVETSSLRGEMKGHISFYQLLSLQKIEILPIMSMVGILPPNNQNLQFSSLHVPKIALESL